MLLTAVVGGVASGAAATAMSIRVLGRRAVLDVPNHRSSHTIPTVRGGGIGLATGTLVVLAIANTHLIGITAIALVVAGLGFGTIGLADDLTGAQRVSVRLVLQCVIAALTVTVIWGHSPRTFLSTVLVSAVAVLWIVSFVNAFNFMDGINGISCAEAVVAGISIGLLARHEHQLALETAAFALAAGSIGFAPFNFPTARVFLGDAGSYFVGAWLAILVIIGLQGSIPPEAMVAPVALYVADTGVTLARRVRQREVWHQSHRDHTYQRLVDLGWSHTQTTGLVFGLVALCSLLGSITLLGSLAGRVTADCGIVALVIGYLVLPGLIEHRTSAAMLDGQHS